MASTSAAIEQRNQDATVWVGGLEDRVDDELLWELFVQAGPLVSVHMPIDKVSGRHGGYAFIEFRTEQDAEYAMRILNTIKLFGKSIIVRKAGDNKNQSTEVGANLFIGNLAPEVDEQMLYSTFGAFGPITTTKIMRDPDSGESKGFGFVNFDAFEASDAAIEAMNGQYLAGRPVVVQYAFRKDAKGERHGSQAERMLAAAMRGSNAIGRPHTLFASAPGQTISTATTSAPMLGQVDTNQAPPMLPPTAILPQSMLPPPLPGYSAGAGAPAGGSMLPPPVPMAMGPGHMPMPGPEGAGAFGYGQPPPVPGGYGMMMPPPVPGAFGGGYGMPPPVPAGYPGQGY